MTKLTAVQQVYFDYHRVSEFDKKILYIMLELAHKPEIIQQLNYILTRLVQSNRAYKRRSVDRLTGRTRAQTRRFRLSRISVRAYGKAGFFPGLVKAS